jgi:DNA polymerase family A
MLPMDIGVGESTSFAYNCNSTQQIAACLWGTKASYDVVVPNGAYKNGRIKTKMIQREFKTTSRSAGEHVATIKGMKWMKDHYGKTDEATLKDFLLPGVLDVAYKTEKNLIENLLGYRETNKKLTSYYEPYIAIAMASGRNTINTQYLHSLTPTGRISSSKPNVQTLPN